MNISKINQTPFSAKVVRENYATRDKKTHEITLKEMTKRQLEESYDSQIRRIQKRKESAFELDSFMKSKEIKEIAKQLPNEDEIEVVSSFELAEDYGQKEIEIQEPLLMYNSKEMQISGKNIDLFTFCPMNKNGSINKNGIVGWLNKIAAYINK